MGILDDEDQHHDEAGETRDQAGAHAARRSRHAAGARSLLW
jgi:hypothetical protein